MRTENLSRAPDQSSELNSSKRFPEASELRSQTFSPTLTTVLRTPSPTKAYSSTRIAQSL